MFLTRQLIAEEEQGITISRTILNETGTAIGTIDLYHIVNQTGFLATWIGALFRTRIQSKSQVRVFDRIVS